MRRECRERFPHHSGLVNPTCMTCMTHMPRCMSGSLTRGKRARHSQRMRNRQFCVSGKKPIALLTTSNHSEKNTFIYFVHYNRLGWHTAMQLMSIYHTFETINPPPRLRTQLSHQYHIWKKNVTFIACLACTCKWLDGNIFVVYAGNPCFSPVELILQYIPRNMHTVLLCFALLWLCNRS